MILNSVKAFSFVEVCFDALQRALLRSTRWCWQGQRHLGQRLGLAQRRAKLELIAQIARTRRKAEGEVPSELKARSDWIALARVADFPTHGLLTCMPVDMSKPFALVHVDGDGLLEDTLLCDLC